MFLRILLKLVKKLFYLIIVSHERDEISGKVKSGQERIITSKPTEIFNSYYYDDFKKLFNSYQFESASISLKNISDNFFYDDYQGKYRYIYDLLISAYSLWDKFNYEKAFNELIKTKGKSRFIKDFDHEKYRKNLDFLEKLRSERKIKKYPRELIVDVFLNAKRRAEEGKFDDALIRLYRVMELISQNLLYHKFKIDPADVKEDQINELPQKIIDKIKTKPGKKITSGISDNFEILAYKNNELEIDYFKDSNIKEILGIRNLSILIHGENPIVERNFNSLIGIVEKFLIKFFVNESNLEQLISSAEIARFI
ncbi:MAG: TIGR02710 family CRISPR-associated CARF protein [Actinobacteria bacterium]|nr:TIGR02710 family CRISPR-associated CARF protein [Actinomycetota bacterium]